MAASVSLVLSPLALHFPPHSSAAAQRVYNPHSSAASVQPVSSSLLRASRQSRRPVRQAGNICCNARWAVVTRAAAGEGPGGSSSGVSDESGDGTDWLANLPDQSAALYACSLPSIEAWLRSLGFRQVAARPESWRIERADWHAELSMDVTDVVIRYLKSGPGNLTRDIERKFSYALSREDVEKAILGGP